MLTLDDTPVPNLIRGYGAAEIHLAQRTLRRSCLLSVDRVIEPWSATDIAALTPADLESVFALGVEIVLLATPGVPRFPGAQIRAAFGARRIGLEVMELGAACRTFNVLVQEGRPVAGAFILGGGG